MTLDPQGRQLSGAGRASSEVGMHLRIYQQRADVQAGVHAHPPVATGFSVAGMDLMDDELPEAIFPLGGVPLVPFAVPGTPALSDVEHAARIMLTARSLGTVNSLAPQDARALRAVRTGTLQVLQQQTQTRSHESQ